eukprot:2958921-Pleurochrysis_carterae.AAC.1
MIAPQTCHAQPFCIQTGSRVSSDKANSMRHCASPCTVACKQLAHDREKPACARLRVRERPCARAG